MQRTWAPTRILVGVDHSEAASRALNVAVTLARRFDAELVALYVAAPAPLATMDRRRRAAELAVNAARVVGEHALVEARAVAQSVPCTTELIFGEPAEVICQRARELEADLIVVGSRGLGRLDRLLTGSVSAAVVQQAPCPVLVARESDPEAS
jgi:nucleotide-binding universal stress UspA family protein